MSTATSTLVSVAANYYQQFDLPREGVESVAGSGGWRRAAVEIDLSRTALVVMHAWTGGTPEQYPGWYRCVSYIPEAERICRDVIPPLLEATRTSPAKVYHVVGGRDYYSDYPGYKRAVELAGPPTPPPARIEADETLKKLRAFRREHAYPGAHNVEDANRGIAQIDFPDPVRPLGAEGVAENSDQLLALCQDDGVNHLIYTGFAINWCLLMSPGGMLDMSRRGLMCSAVREATAAVENHESLSHEGHKEEGLWRTSLQFGFVFNADDLAAAMTTGAPRA